MKLKNFIHFESGRGINILEIEDYQITSSVLTFLITNQKDIEWFKGLIDPQRPSSERTEKEMEADFIRAYREYFKEE